LTSLAISQKPPEAFGCEQASSPSHSPRPSFHLPPPQFFFLERCSPCLFFPRPSDVDVTVSTCQPEGSILREAKHIPFDFFNAPATPIPVFLQLGFSLTPTRRYLGNRRFRCPPFHAPPERAMLIHSLSRPSTWSLAGSQIFQRRPLGYTVFFPHPQFFKFPTTKR